MRIRSGAADGDERRLTVLVGLAVGCRSQGGLATQRRIAVIGNVIVEGDRAPRRNLEIAGAGIGLYRLAGDLQIAASAVSQVVIDEVAQAFVLIE